MQPTRRARASVSKHIFVNYLLQPVTEPVRAVQFSHRAVHHAGLILTERSVEKLAPVTLIILTTDSQGHAKVYLKIRLIYF